MKANIRTWLHEKCAVVRKLSNHVSDKAKDCTSQIKRTGATQTTEKQRQVYRLIGLSVIVMVLLSMVIYYLNDDPATYNTNTQNASLQRSKEKMMPLVSALDTVTLDDRWLSKEDDQLQSHDQLLKRLQKNVNQLTQSHKSDQQHNQTLQAQLETIKAQHEQQLHDLAKTLKQHSTKLSESSTVLNPIMSAMMHEQGAGLTSSNVIDHQLSASSTHSFSTSPFNHVAFPQTKPTNDNQSQHTADYLPAGTFAKAIMLGGLDAATNLSASSNPRPVLLKIIDQGELPNHHHAHLKGCVITAAGMGDVSSERGYIRLERLSCVQTKQGERKIIDVPVFGTVFGPSGQDGVRGTAVYRAKQLVANSFAAGLASGFGKALQNQSMNAMSATPYGMAGQFTPAKTLEAGAANGINTALDRLADYYIKRAERYHPIVQIHAGTLVDVVFLKGVQLRPYSLSGALVSASHEPLESADEDN